MSKYVPDVSSHRWVIIATARSKRPGTNGEKHLCPLCEGHEKLTPPEVFRFGKGEKDKSGWQVRVVPNKFPITDYHEVIVHSPDHKRDLEDLPLNHVRLIIKAYRERYNFYRKKGQVLIFCNHGEHAGASLDHPHTQLVVIPFQINLDTLAREPLNNLVDANKFFNVYCPDFSQWPYEVWISPKNEGKVFGDVTDDEVNDLSQIIQQILKRLKKIHEHNSLTKLPFGYNFYIYPKETWYIRLIPRFIHRAGFELGTGLSVNIVEPTDAMYELRGMEERVGHVLKKLKSFK